MRVFTDKFIPSFCNQTPAEYARDPDRLDGFMEMLVSRCFVDLTAEVKDRKIVEVQERLITNAIEAASDANSLATSPVLTSWFGALTNSEEAKQCVAYLFKNKCERIDQNFLSMKNLQKVYLEQLGELGS